MPALPLIRPATCASEASRNTSSSVGWLERWSLIATSPTPINASLNTMSPRTVPVRVVGGMW